MRFVTRHREDRWLTFLFPLFLLFFLPLTFAKDEEEEEEEEEEEKEEEEDGKNSKV